MRRPLRNRLAAATVGLLLIAPAVVSPSVSSAAPPTPTPNPTSDYCKQFGPALSDIMDAIKVLSDLPAGTSNDEMMATAASTFGSMSKALAPLPSTKPPAPISTQLTEQIKYWGKASTAMANKKMLSPLLKEKRLSAEMTKFQTLVQGSTAYCDANAPTLPPDSVTPDQTAVSVSDVRSVTPIKVTATGVGKWTAKAAPGQPWLKVTRGTGVSGGTFNVVAKKNTGADRSGTITITQGNVTATVTVNQAGKPVA